jgi:hypothetical protein
LSFQVAAALSISIPARPANFVKKLLSFPNAADASVLILTSGILTDESCLGILSVLFCFNIFCGTIDVGNILPPG